MELVMNNVNQISKGTMIYTHNESVESICLIAKGRVVVYNTGMKVVLGPGSFLGVTDLVNGRYEANYFAVENVTVYPIPMKKIEDLAVLIEAKSEYRGTMIAGLNRYIVELYKNYTILKKGSDRLVKVLQEGYQFYQNVGGQSSIPTLKFPKIEEMEVYQSEVLEEDDRTAYYMECATLPQEIQKAYYSHGSQIAMHHIEEQLDVIAAYIEECKELSGRIFSECNSLLGEQEENLYQAVIKLILDLRKVKGKTKEISELAEALKSKIYETETLVAGKTGRKLAVDKEKVEQMYQLLLTEDAVEEEEVSTETAVKYAGKDTAAMESELEGSLEKILKYSQLPEETCQKFTGYVMAFIALKDKSDTDDASRKLRRSIASVFYDIYEAVFLRAYEEGTVSRLIDMFLCYGYMDEHLLTKEQLLELYCLEDVSPEDGPCKVYNIKQWLTAVYEGEKEPSKSEFDMDYAETLREMKKSGQIREEEMKQALEDPKKKLHYEIHNMFSYNNRVVSGQISIFVPFLHKDQFMGHIDKAFLSANKIYEIMNNILAVDYSLFYRESMYSNKEKQIDRAFIMTEVFPDIILLPTYGTNGAMWQEITGKRRTSSGRFLFPIFAESDIEETFIRICGRFRWELCRTMQGPAWNDVKTKSLTSEYVDYIQFYRKNRLLSDEKKEKLKMQIQKGRGNTREIFVIDYLLWVRNEAKGSIRLNKVVREILATYCPFTKEIRQKISTQPMFEEAMARYTREKAKKVKELDLRYRTMENKKIELTQELIDTLAFYRDL